MGEAIAYAVGGISDHKHRDPTLQLVMAGPVQRVADTECAQNSSSKEHYLPRRAAFTQRLGEWVHLVPAMAEILVSDNKIRSAYARVCN